MRYVTYHTKESLMKKIIEVGECWEWQGYAANKGKVPQVMNGGKMMPVRRLFSDLEGKKTFQGGYFVASCKNNKCVNPDHTKHYTQKQFNVYRGKMAGDSTVTNFMRAAKIQAHKRATCAKLTQEKADEIRASDKPSRELGLLYGVDKTLINRIKAGKAWVNLSASVNPFAALMR